MEKVLLFIASLALTLPLPAQDGIERVVGEIARHNTRLRASEAEAEATRQAGHADNTLQAPEISLGRLWGSPAGVGHRTDISVAQPFDLATVSGTRGRVARSQDRHADAQLLLERRDVLLSARLTAIDVVYYNIRAAELERRRRHADALCQAQRRRLDAGETNIMEYNNARLALSRLETALRTNEAERQAALTTLTQMNGGEAVTLTDTTYNAPPRPPRWGGEELPFPAHGGNLSSPLGGTGGAFAAFCQRGYLSALTWTLNHRRWVLSATAVALIIAIAAFCTLGSNFLPPFNEGSFTINVSTLPGVSLAESDSIGHMAEATLGEVPEVLAVGRKTGRAELDEHALGVNVSEIEVPYELRERPKDSLLADIRRRLATIPGVSVEVGSPISHRIDAMLSGTQAAIAIKIFGDDLNRMFLLGNEIKAAASGVEGVADFNVEQQVERPQLLIKPRRDQLATYGITMPQFAAIVETLLEGREVSEVYEGSQPFALTVKADDTSRSSIADIRRMPVSAGAACVPLENIADITSAAGPNTINRENAQRKIVVSCNVAGRDMLSVVRDIQRVVDEKITLPDGCRVEYGGQFESERAASRTLMLTSLLALLVVFGLLFFQFRDLTQAAVVMLNLPLALIGGVIAVAVTGGSLSIPAIIGFISLFGIATRNGMLLVARYNDLRRTGLPARESVLHGSLDRLNPILMTALTTALSLIPMVLGGDLPGNEIQSPMAKVILGGLLTSTLLNGFIIPIMYLLRCKNVRS